jgi:hypothetical protein
MIATIKQPPLVPLSVHDKSIHPADKTA